MVKKSSWFDERNRKKKLTEEVWEDTMNACTDGLLSSITMTAENEPGGNRLPVVDNIAPKKILLTINVSYYRTLLIATEKPSYRD